LERAEESAMTITSVDGWSVSPEAEALPEWCQPKRINNPRRK